ncbi:MAG: hypothetical protein A3J74_09665 [Elusimicrobia bacterium RIFCSPHIGHO2_02_FULL_57_9]|nr:MAG: hypothetical protein A3J74_09665 [Elusimicrobia bacterium RIFCSPHIGHO2_02_FULL_57_9]
MRKQKSGPSSFFEKLVFGLAGLLALIILVHLVKRALVRSEMLSLRSREEQAGIEKHELDGSPAEMAVSQLPPIRVSSPGRARRASEIPSPIKK